jgi:23S rRNA pseudouridine1911/1915/1917 synthase
MDIQVLYQDDDCLVVNKPPGLIVNRAQSVKGETVQDWIEQSGVIAGITDDGTPETKEFISRSGIVHRIDKETSGILVCAKNVKAFLRLQQEFKERDVQKTYLAIVHGDLVPASGEINAPVARLPWNREHFGILPGGKESVTAYTKLSSFPHGKLKEQVSFVELRPHTGRTHQIRVHMKYINHPLVGDYLYAGRKTSRLDRTWVPRCMLHAWKITILQPATGAPLAIEAPIPDDMSRIIKGNESA